MKNKRKFKFIQESSLLLLLLALNAQRSTLNAQGTAFTYQGKPQLDILLHHRARLTAWQPDEANTRQLSLLVEGRRRFVADKVRATNRLHDALKSYFPQALALVGENLTSRMACAFLKKWPRLPSVKAVKPAVLRQFYYAHHSRSPELLSARLQIHAHAQP